MIAMNFDASFVARLQQRDPETCTFLVSSFTPVLEARLRYKLRNHDDIEDVRNETFYRVLCLVDGGRIRQPERFGSFVSGVCDRVAQESRRKAHAAEPLPEAGLELFDGQPHLDTLLVAEERRAGLWHAVMQLPEEDRRLIVALFAEERERCEIARESGIGNIGVNVRLCRTLKRLRAQILQQAPAVKPARRKTGCTPFRTRRIPARGARSANRWATMAA